MEDPIIQLIARYRELIRETRLADELYKWRLVEKYKGRPEVDAEDIRAEVLSVKYSNLVYQIAPGVMRHILGERPEEYREALRALFDENQPVETRIVDFQNEVLRIYRQLESKLGTHHDERTISAMLTVKYPDRYTFYKDSFYRKFCDALSVEHKKRGGKFVHYLELVEGFVNDYITEDTELLELVESFKTPDCYADTTHKILAQDILYQTLDKSTDVGYWVFQANPSHYDLADGLATGEGIDTWTVTKHLKEIKAGDKVILWSTGPQAGCYALAEITQEPSEIGGEYVAGIDITDNLVESPLLQPTVRATPGLEHLKAGTQGTVFSATKKQYELMRGLISAEQHDTPAKGEEPRRVKVGYTGALNLILYGPPGTGKTYRTIDKAVAIIDGTSNDDHSANKRRFDELRKQGQIEFVTFHQNYGYEDFVVGISPDITSGNLRFDRREGIFKQLVDRATQNWNSATSARDAVPDFNRVFNAFFSPLIQEEVKEIEVPLTRPGYGFKITNLDLENGRIKEFVKQSGGTGHDLLVKNIKAIFEGELDYGTEGLGIYYNALNRKLKEFAKTLARPTDRQELKDFVLIIDEINRANISRVFGELITLLEDDKRLGRENEMKVTLPNGDRGFGVPPNLYVIGTMNTADKSIALIDIALRRRFEFEGFYPQYGQLDKKAAKLLSHLNDRIYEQKKSPDYLIGHAYFMTGEPLHQVLRGKVIPLLIEYFSGKVNIICDLFKGSGWNVSYDASRWTWDITEDKDAAV